MPIVVIANPKGGVGKSTLSTNVAGYWASQGHAVMLGDVDRQQSARLWLGLRPEAAAPIATWDVQRDFIVRPPKGTTHVVLDTPAGLHGTKLKELLRLADKVLVPLQPSIFDIYATREFVDHLADMKSASGCDIGLVGMRVDERTIAADQLRQFVGGLGLPVLGMLRPTQNYVQLAARGLTVFDVPPTRVARDREQWQGICDWLDASP
ncbi:MAG: ParA family protein [Pseudomonadota bacterium]|nr:ParA family protein [Pseudomonadota bacterium]